MIVHMEPSAATDDDRRPPDGRMPLRVPPRDSGPRILDSMATDHGGNLQVYHLMAFREVANELSFTKAAEKLHCAQSTVTSQIKELERSLGVELFHRDRRPIELTSAGALLQARLGPILRSVEKANAEVREVKQAVMKQGRAVGRPAVHPSPEVC